jgi:hypothetical protein
MEDPVEHGDAFRTPDTTGSTDTDKTFGLSWVNPSLLSVPSIDTEQGADVSLLLKSRLTPFTTG